MLGRDPPRVALFNGSAAASFAMETEIEVEERIVQKIAMTRLMQLGFIFHWVFPTSRMQNLRLSGVEPYILNRALELMKGNEF